MCALIQKATCLIHGKDAVLFNPIICDHLLKQLNPIINYTLVQCSPSYGCQCSGPVAPKLVMVVIHELIKPMFSNCSIRIARSHMKDFICMSSSPFQSIREAPTSSLLEIIDKKLLFIRTNLLLSTSRLKF